MDVRATDPFFIDSCNSRAPITYILKYFSCTYSETGNWQGSDPGLTFDITSSLKKPHLTLSVCTV